MKTFIRLREELETHSLQESPFGDPYNMQGRAKDAHKKHNEMLQHHKIQSNRHFASAQRADKRGDIDTHDYHYAEAMTHDEAAEAHQNAIKSLTKHNVDHKKYKEHAAEAHHLSKYTEDW